MMLIMSAPSRPLSLPRDNQVVTDKFVDPQLPLLEAGYGDINAKIETSGSVTLDPPSTDETPTVYTGAQFSQLAESDNQTSALLNNGTEISLSSLEESASTENASEAQAEFAPDTSFSLASPFSSVGSCKLEN